MPITLLANLEKLISPPLLKAGPKSIEDPGIFPWGFSVPETDFMI
jgi:hypothetical protein